MSFTGHKIKEVWNGNLDSGEHRFIINRTGLAKGVYLVMLLTKDQKTIQKIIIQ